MGLRLRGRAALLITAAALTAMPLPPVEAAPAPACAVIAVSPSFATDRTVACYTFMFTNGTASEVRVHVTRDGMRSWRQAAAAGVNPTQLSTPTQLFFVGTTLFLQLAEQGLLFSDDLGETFRVADPLGGSPNGRDNLTAVATPAAVPLPAQPFPLVEIAYGTNSPNGASLIRPPVHQRVPGSTDADIKFAPYTDTGGGRRWLSIAERRPGAPTPDPQVVAVWDCDALLVCTENRHEFRGKNGALDLVAAPDFARSEVVFATTRDTSQESNKSLNRLWRSADGGRSFTEVAPVAALRRAVGKQTGELATGVTFTGGRTVVLRMEFDDTFAKVSSQPVRQILVSSDLGATWRLVAYGRSAKQRGPRGTLPWNGMGGMTAQERGRVQAVAGRLFTLATINDDLRPYCSRDGGRTWATSC